MKATHFYINTLTTTIFIFTLAVAAQAQNRVFVSSVGDDLNPCTRTSPCRNFQRGHDAVLAGGEVVALDSAGYGQVTITKSVTITGESVYAGISASSGNGITIATAGITVILRSLTIEGLGSGSNGINVTNFSVLQIENCIVNGFTGRGILVNPSATGTRTVFIKDSTFRNNAGFGINLFNGSSTALSAAIEGTRTESNGGGIDINGSGLTATAHGCLSSGNSGVGFQSIGAVLNIESSVSSNNAAGIDNFSNGTVRVSNSTVTDNAGFGFVNVGATFESRGNNTLRGNHAGGAQNNGTITTITGT